MYAYNITSFQRVSASPLVSLVKKSATEDALIAILYTSPRYNILKSTDGINFQAIINNTFLVGFTDFELVNQVFYTWTSSMLYYLNGVLILFCNILFFFCRQILFPYLFHPLLHSLLTKHVLLMENSIFQ